MTNANIAAGKRQAARRAEREAQELRESPHAERWAAELAAYRANERPLAYTPGCFVWG